MVGVQVIVGVHVTVGVQVSVHVGVDVLVGVALGVGVSVVVGVSVDEAVGEGVDVDGVVGTLDRGAPARIQSRMSLTSASDSSGGTSGMGLPNCDAAVIVTFVSRKLFAGLPGATRSRPAWFAARLAGATLTKLAYDAPASSTRLPAPVALLWQPALRQWTSKMLLWMAANPEAVPAPVPLGCGPLPAHPATIDRAHTSTVRLLRDNGVLRMTSESTECMATLGVG